MNWMDCPLKSALKHLQNIDHPRPERNGGGQMKREYWQGQMGDAYSLRRLGKSALEQSLLVKELSQGPGELLGALHTQAHPGLTTSSEKDPCPRHKRTCRLCKVINLPKVTEPGPCAERTVWEFSGPLPFLQASPFYLNCAKGFQKQT